MFVENIVIKWEHFEKERQSIKCYYKKNPTVQNILCIFVLPLLISIIP